MKISASMPSLFEYLLGKTISIHFALEFEEVWRIDEQKYLNTRFLTQEFPPLDFSDTVEADNFDELTHLFPIIKEE